jgi:hypothetical protein
MEFLHHPGAGGEDSAEGMNILIRAGELLDVVSGTEGRTIALQYQNFEFLICRSLIQNLIQGCDDI